MCAFSYLRGMPICSTLRVVVVIFFTCTLSDHPGYLTGNTFGCNYLSQSEETQKARTWSISERLL